MMGKGCGSGCLTNPQLAAGRGPMFMPAGVRPMVAGGGLIPGKGILAPGGLPQIQRPPGRRAWSPHAGSRAIRQCTATDEQGNPLPPGLQKEKEEEERKSSSRSPSSRKSSSSSSKKRKKKKKKKSKKKKKEKSSSSSVSSSSARSRSRSRGKDDKDPEAVKRKLEKDTEKEDNKEVEEAKMVALQKLQELQKIEPKEARAKEWRMLLRNWHPDKNPDNKDVATEVFQFLQKGKNLLNLQ